ncbi:hypothetical protein [uncultured Mucilaginibacter sp.]|uniref:hypothetical protein n=1 Tax=uncultured Mucilaginibacter sp. TaxID=797541 RepID=UPI0025E8D817|nr:hypothetical protein [uncultured Mucilaginibacter sp.]
MADEYNYVQFPLFLISDLYTSGDQKNVIDELFDYGIFTYSKQFKTDETAACRQVLYCYYRGGLTSALKSVLAKLYKTDLLLFDEDYNGFQGDTFEPYELDDFVAIIKNDDSKREMCLEFYGMHLAMKSLKLTGPVPYIIQTAKEVAIRVSKHEYIYGREPLVMLKTDLMLDYYQKKKSIDDIIIFTAYAGIKSIIGKKEFAGTTKKMIVDRMVGAKSDKVLQEFLKNNDLKQIHAKYIKRYWFDKLIDELLKRGFVRSKMPIRFGRKSRICISCKLNPRELAFAVADYWLKTTGEKKLKEIKEQEREAKKLFHQLITAP